MAGARLGRSTKRAPLGFCAKVTLVILVGLAFIVLWSIFSSSSSSYSAAAVSSQRSSFDEIFDPDALPAAAGAKRKEVGESKKRNPSSPPKDGSGSGSPERERKEGEIEGKAAAAAKNGTREAEGQLEKEREGGEEKADVEGLEELVEEEGGDDEDMEDGVDVNPEVEEVGEERSGGNQRKRKKKKKKKLGPLFDPGARYNWKLCGGRYGHRYVPCVDMEGGRRHHERSCPRIPLMCLVSLPQEYKPPPPWPERESKVLPLLHLVARFEVFSSGVMLIFASI